MTEPRPATTIQEQSGADSHSLLGDALFIDTDSGNYQVGDGSPALGLGFRNFPMDRFGVRKPELKKIAKAPKLPEIGVKISESGRLPQNAVWGRCKVKNIVGMGEVSAAGLPGETGVMIESLPWGSWQMEEGFQVADVILGLNGEKVDTVDDLLRLYEAASEESFVVQVFRGQNEIALTVRERV